MKKIMPDSKEHTDLGMMILHGPEQDLEGSQFRDVYLRARKLISLMVQFLKETDFTFACRIWLKSKKTGGIYG